MELSSTKAKAIIWMAKMNFQKAVDDYSKVREEIAGIEIRRMIYDANNRDDGFGPVSNRPDVSQYLKDKEVQMLEKKKEAEAIYDYAIEVFLLKLDDK